MPVGFLEDDSELFPAPEEDEDQPARFVGPRRPFSAPALPPVSPAAAVNIPDVPETSLPAPEPPSPALDRVLGDQPKAQQLGTAPVVDRYNKATSDLADFQSRRPLPPDPKWWQRAAAGAVGALAGMSNAAGRTRRSIDPTAAVQGIMGAPGYNRDLQWWERENAAKQAEAGAAKGQLDAFNRQRALDTEERLREAQAKRYEAQARYDEEDRGLMAKERQSADQQKAAMAQDAGFIRGWDQEKLVLDPTDPSDAKVLSEVSAEGWRSKRSAADPSKVIAVPPPMMRATEDLPIPGRKVGSLVPYREWKAAQDAAQKRAEIEAKPGPEDVQHILLNPDKYPPAQVAQAQRMWGEMHRPPVNNFLNTDAGKNAIEDVAQSLAKGDLTRLKDIASLRGDQRLQLYARAKQINPNFNTAEIDRKIKMEDYFTNGKGADQLMSFGSFMEHAGAAVDAVNLVKNTNAALLNKPINEIRSLVTRYPEYRKLLTAIEPVKKEFETFLLNNHALYAEDRASADKILDPNSSLADFMAAIGQMGHTVDARMNEANYRYRKVMGRDLTDPFTSEAIEGAKKIGVTLGKTAALAPASGAPPAPPQAPQSVPQVGGTFNGQKVLKVTRIE